MPTMPDTLRLVTLGQVLRDARQQRGWRLRHVADAMGVAIPTVHGWEVGTKHVPALRLIELADLLRIDLGRVARRRAIAARRAA